MKNKWSCEDLRKSMANRILNTVLLLLIAGSYVPQVRLLLDRRSAMGIAPSYIMIVYLFTATQFTMVLLYSSYGRPIMGCIADQKIRGLDAYGAILGLIQITVMWIGSILVLVLLFLYPDQIHSGRGGNEAPLAINYTTLTEHRRYPRTILSICIMHACIWVLPAIAISIPRPREVPLFHPIQLFVGFCDYFLIPTCIVLVMCIFPLQIKELISSQRSIHESSLSPSTLALQMIAFVLLGLSWKIDIGEPGDPFNITPPGCIQPWALYRLGAWQWVNNMIFGVGQGLLLLIYLWLGSQGRALQGHTQDMDETTALL